MDFAGPFDALEIHGRDAVLWSVAAILFLILPVLCETFGFESPAEFLKISRISFFVLATTACFHALCACKRKERLWGLVGLGALYLFEAMVLLACRG